MFNVLPDIFKDHIKRDYKMRRFVIVIIFIILVQLIFIISLLPAWLSSIYREKEALSQVELIGSSTITTNRDTIIQNIQSVNDKLNIINTSFISPKISPILKSIISYKNKNISITSFSFSLNSSNKSSINIEGLSLSREDLVAFVKSLQASGQFSDVISPVSNLQKEKNINFSISLKTIQ